jgi:hypothetical protein
MNAGIACRSRFFSDSRQAEPVEIWFYFYCFYPEKGSNFNFFHVCLGGSTLLTYEETIFLKVLKIRYMSMVISSSSRCLALVPALCILPFKHFYLTFLNACLAQATLFHDFSPFLSKPYAY